MNTSGKKLISIVAPVYNEEAVIEEFVHRIQSAIKDLEFKYSFEIILVDDGSRDNSLLIAKKIANSEPRLRVIELRCNYGQTAALQAGIDVTLGDIIITMDADLQHFPEEIPLFINKIESGSDLVCGWRHDRKEGIIRRWPSKVANYLIRKASGVTVHDVGTTYRAYTKEIVKDLQLLGENHRFVPVFAKKVGAKIEELKIKNIERPEGVSSYGISRTINVFLDLFFIYFYTRYFDRPIRIFGKISFALFSIACIICSVLLAKFCITGVSVVREHSGWVQLSILLFITSMQLLLTGILAEVLARLYYSSANEKTAYKIRYEWNSNILGQAA